MPEGDTVRLTAKALDAALVGRVVVRAELRWPTLAGIDLAGRVVLGTGTYGKHLLTRFDDGRTLHTHLRMDGVWRIRTATEQGRSPWVRALLATEVNSAIGIRLGLMGIVPTAAEGTIIGHLGPDVLTDDFPEHGLAIARANLSNRPDSIAAVLLDQRAQAGLGTIWTSESLFTRRTSPWQRACDVTDPDSLLMTARELMLMSVRGHGRPALRVHGRAGRPCVRCGAYLREARVGAAPMDRIIVWCASCQPKSPAATGDRETTRVHDGGV